MTEENGDLLANSHNILNCFSQLLNVCRVSGVRQKEIVIAEPLVPDPDPFEVEIASGKFERYKLPGIDQILADLIQAGDETLQSEIHKLVNSVCNKEELPDRWKESIIVPIYKKSGKTGCSNYHGISLLSTLYIILSNILVSSLCSYMDEIIGDNQCGLRRNRSTTNQIFCVHQIRKKMGVQ
jgi:hypothetical protein